MLDLNFNPFPILSSNRLVLRRISLDDIEDYFAFKSNPVICNALDKEPLLDLEASKERIKLFEDNLNNNDAIYWVITLKGSNKLIGDIAFYNIDKTNHRAEIGYALLPNFHKEGIMNESMRLVLHYGFSQMKLHSVEALTNPLNEKSYNLLLKNGFVKEGFIKENYFFRDMFLDTNIYSLLKRNFTN